MDIVPFVDIVEDLNQEFAQHQRYQRLVDALQTAIPCDAIALLKLDGAYLRPMAVSGLKEEAMARCFAINHHPRLKIILQNTQLTRFESNSDLPDPYDGLIDNKYDQLHVHDCMGSSIYINGKAWGVLTLDSMTAGSFNHLNPIKTRAYIAAITAVIKASHHIEQLKLRTEHSHQLTQHLIQSNNSIENIPNIIGHSKAIKTMLSEINTVAASDLSVLITGETGVGKELVATKVHQLSRRSQTPLIKINCAALPENIVESELFGHLKGAFSGAINDRSGRFELADGGTLFLDEVGELTLPVQAKLLRVLQSGEIQRVGSDKTISVDVRIIAVTNRNLEQAVKDGSFRSDLFHRLSVYPLPVPPLRHRDQDYILLAGYFLEKSQQQLGVSKLHLNRAATNLLSHYSWPGNVRELEHLLSRAALKAIAEQGRDSTIVSIDTRHLDLYTATSNLPEPRLEDHTGGEFKHPGLRETVDQFQRELIEKMLHSERYNLASTARKLKLDRSNLVRTMKRLGIA